MLSRHPSPGEISWQMEFLMVLPSAHDTLAQQVLENHGLSMYEQLLPRKESWSRAAHPVHLEGDIADVSLPAPVAAVVAPTLAAAVAFCGAPTIVAVVAPTLAAAVAAPAAVDAVAAAVAAAVADAVAAVAAFLSPTIAVAVGVAPTIAAAVAVGVAPTIVAAVVAVVVIDDGPAAAEPDVEGLGYAALVGDESAFASRDVDDVAAAAVGEVDLQEVGPVDQLTWHAADLQQQNSRLLQTHELCHQGEGTLHLLLAFV